MTIISAVTTCTASAFLALALTTITTEGNLMLITHTAMPGTKVLSVHRALGPKPVYTLQLQSKGTRQTLTLTP